MITTADLLRATEDPDVAVPEIIESIQANGGFDDVPEHIKDVVLGDTPNSAKAQFLRFVVATQIEKRRREIMGDSSSKTLKTPVPEGAEIDTLKSYETAIKQREDYLDELPFNEQLEARRNEVVSQVDEPVLEMFSDEERRLLTESVMPNANAETRKNVSRLLERATNLQGFSKLKYSKLENQRREFIRTAADTLVDLSAEELALVSRPVTTETPTADSIRLSEIIKTGSDRQKEIDVLKSLIVQIEDMRTELEEQYTRGANLITGGYGKFFNLPVDEQISSLAEKHGGAIPAARALLDSRDNLEREVAKIEEQWKSLYDEAAALEQKIRDRFTGWWMIDKYTESLAVMLMKDGLDNVLSDLLAQGKDAKSALELIIEKLKAKIEFYEDKPWLGEKLEREADTPFISPEGPKRKRRKSGTARAEQLKRSTAGPKKGPSPAADKGGRKKR